MKFRNIAIISGLAVLLAGTGFVAESATAPKPLPGSRAEIYKTIDGVKLPLHIFEPKGQKAGDKRPAIVFFFGGGWNGGSPKQFEKQCAYLASRGMVAMTVEYRVKSRHGVKAVSCFSDAKSAIRWVRQNAQRLGIDPNRIAAGGGSAGGHLAGALGTISAFDESTEDTTISAVPNALVLFNPALVLAPVEGYEPRDPKKLAGLEKRMGVPPQQLSPYHNIGSDLPPTIIFHGTADTTVPYNTVELFTEQAKKKGNAVELVPYEGQGHGFFNYKETRKNPFIDTVKKMDAFLVSLGYLQGPDRVDAFIAADQ
ncbi:alpha/beta hydrolase [Pontiella sulfatireligans]|uniref:Carboxylesterase NlhH n=1 Tax=Pontiella sulfatireligans TaxID=2750658 RepID=A0A6C2UPP0_9BACT|nr:alpha/beta hydrolase [Pontiella sulfatireligans]VGO21284.1 Carboxylesterase NlhH [Pontiella sulfatireligans]